MLCIHTEREREKEKRERGRERERAVIGCISNVQANTRRTRSDGGVLLDVGRLYQFIPRKLQPIRGTKAHMCLFVIGSCCSSVVFTRRVISDWMRPSCRAVRACAPAEGDGGYDIG